MEKVGDNYLSATAIKLGPLAMALPVSCKAVMLGELLRNITLRMRKTGAKTMKRELPPQPGISAAFNFFYSSISGADVISFCWSSTELVL